MSNNLKIVEENVVTQILTVDTNEDILTMIRESSSADAIQAAEDAAASAVAAAESADEAETSATAFTEFKEDYDDNQGIATMVAGSVEVALPGVTANSIIMVSSMAALVVGPLQVIKEVGVGFEITGLVGDAGAVGWFLVNPGV